MCNVNLPDISVKSDMKTTVVFRGNEQNLHDDLVDFINVKAKKHFQVKQIMNTLSI